MSAAALAHVMRETIRRNRVKDGLVYLQVTRGEGPREFAFPDGRRAAEPSSASHALISPSPRRRRRAQGIAVKTMPDIRWGRCDIKTVMLLPACLAKEAARARRRARGVACRQRRLRHRGRVE